MLRSMSGKFSSGGYYLSLRLTYLYKGLSPKSSFLESEGILEDWRKFRSCLINFEHLSSHLMMSDNAQSLFTTGDVGECVLRISDWHEVGSPASNTYDSPYSCSSCCGISWCKYASYIWNDIVNCSLTCLMNSSDGGATSFNTCSTAGH